jgi:hypothetical protein
MRYSYSGKGLTELIDQKMVPDTLWSCWSGFGLAIYEKAAEILKKWEIEIKD